MDSKEQPNSDYDPNSTLAALKYQTDTKFQPTQLISQISSANKLLGKSKEGQQLIQPTENLNPPIKQTLDLFKCSKISLKSLSKLCAGEYIAQIVNLKAISQ